MPIVYQATYIHFLCTSLRDEHRIVMHQFIYMVEMAITSKAYVGLHYRKIQLLGMNGKSMIIYILGGGGGLDP